MNSVLSTQENTGSIRLVNECSTKSVCMEVLFGCVFTYKTFRLKVEAMQIEENALRFSSCQKTGACFGAGCRLCSICSHTECTNTDSCGNDARTSGLFDAAWGRANTEEILNILDRYDVKTTFFLVGFWAEKHPDLVAEIAARGHEIGNHSATHPHMAQLSAAQIRDELKKCSDLVESIIGVPTTLFRPPYGEYNDAVVRISREEGYECVQWNVDSLDWKNLGKENMIRQCTKDVNPGDIVLFHNDSKYILEALPQILEYYKQKEYRIIPVSEILLQGETWIDHAGKQHPCTSSPVPQSTAAPHAS